MVRSQIVYGSDDRIEPYEAEEAELSALVRNSIVALVPKPLLELGEEGSVRIVTESYGRTYDLCDGERFAEQPSAASCSGVVIAPDAVLTAAHCLREGFGPELRCDGHYYVFDYLYRAVDELESVTTADVYECASLATLNEPDGSDTGLAVVRLERDVGGGRGPVQIAERGPALADPVTVIGFPGGIPAKLDSGASVMDVSTSDGMTFTLDSDTFGSSSGCGIFNERLQLVGALLSGSRDYSETEAGCFEVRHVAAPAPEASEAAAQVWWLVERIERVWAETPTSSSSADPDPTVESPGEAAHVGGSCHIAADAPQSAGAAAWLSLIALVAVLWRRLWPGKPRVIR